MAAGEPALSRDEITPHRLLCGHLRGSRKHGALEYCCECGSFYDSNSGELAVEYNSLYGRDRFHDDRDVADCKIAALRHWIERCQIRLHDKVVCEIGFGGAGCLRFILDNARYTYGVEVSEGSFASAQSLDIPTEHLLNGRYLPEQLSYPVDLWIFQDSFEHVPDPAALLDWIKSNSSAASEVLLVLPRADCFSRLLLGRLWPHLLPDHVFHWSKAGLKDFFAGRGFMLKSSFFPLKKITLKTALAHICLKLGIKMPQPLAAAVPGFKLWLNFGEMGMLFSREK